MGNASLVDHSKRTAGHEREPPGPIEPPHNGPPTVAGLDHDVTGTRRNPHDEGR